MSATEFAELRFEQLINSNRKVLVDFWTQSCIPCRKMAPILDKLAAELEDLEIVKIDAEAEPDLAKQLAVKGVPTLILFLDGVEVGRKQGFVAPAELRQWLKAQ